MLDARAPRASQRESEQTDVRTLRLVSSTCRDALRGCLRLDVSRAPE